MIPVVSTTIATTLDHPMPRRANNAMSTFQQDVPYVLPCIHPSESGIEEVQSVHAFLLNNFLRKQPSKGDELGNTRWMYSIVGLALHRFTSIACTIPIAAISSKWLQSCSLICAVSSALCCCSRSDCNQQWQHTLANRSSLSSAVSSALCCCSCSFLLWSLSCRTASAQILGVLSRMHTTARADRKELSAETALCRSRLETWHCNYRMGIVLFLWLAAVLWWILQRPRALCTLLLLQAAWAQVCLSPDVTPCARQLSQLV